MGLMGMTEKQLDLVWRKVIVAGHIAKTCAGHAWADENDWATVREWCQLGQRIIEAEKEYAALLTLQRNLILTEAFRYYPRMARRLLKSLDGKTASAARQQPDFLNV